MRKRSALRVTDTRARMRIVHRKVQKEAYVTTGASHPLQCCFTAYIACPCRTGRMSACRKGTCMAYLGEPHVGQTPATRESCAGALRFGEHEDHVKSEEA